MIQNIHTMKLCLNANLILSSTMSWIYGSIARLIDSLSLQHVDANVNYILIYSRYPHNVPVWKNFIVTFRNSKII